MADQTLPAYDDSNQEAPPNYVKASTISARWHVINTPAKGNYGYRGMSLVSDQSVVTTSPDPSRAGMGYDLLFVDSMQIEVHPTAPSTGPSGSPPNKPWKTPVVARIMFAHEDPREAKIVFTDSGKASFIVDAHGIRDLITMEDAKSSRPQLVTLFNIVDERSPLPFAWSLEENTDGANEPIPQTAASSETTTESNKRSWKFGSKSKSTTPAPENPKTKQQRQGLSSNLALIDARSNAYATFTNEFFKDVTSKIPSYSKHVNQTKSWGHLDIHDPRLSTVRSAYPVVEKWSDSDLELVVLLSLMVVLEVNLKVNGGSANGSMFSQAVFAGSGGEALYGKDKLPALVSAGLGFLGNGSRFAVQGFGS